MTETDLQRVAATILKLAPAGALSPAITGSLAAPTMSALAAASEALISSGQFDLAATVYNAFIDQPGAGVWPTVGLARIASRRGDAPAVVAAAWSECLQQFPEDAAPIWFVNVAQAERDRGDHQAAERYLRRCCDRFPQFVAGYAALAQTLCLQKRHLEGIAAWRAVLGKFRGQVQPHWYVGLASALRGEGQIAEEARTLEDFAEVFPAESVAYRARITAESEDWPGALELWERCLQSAVSVKPEWLDGRAMALFRLWRPEEALEAWSDANRRFPHFVPTHLNLAKALEELGLCEAAESFISDLIRRFPHRATEQWFILRARCVRDRPDGELIAAAMADFDKRFPNSVEVRRWTIECALARNDRLSVVSSVIEDAAARFPQDRFCLAQYVKVLLASGRLAAAERIAAELSSHADDHFALVSRWHVDQDRHGAPAIQDSVQQACSRRSWDLGGGMSICVFLLNLRISSASEAALHLCESLGGRFPGRIALVCIKACLLIVLHLNERALEIIDSVPPQYQGANILELRAWAAARRGDLQAAREIWNKILEIQFFPAVHAPEPVLELVTPERLAMQPGTVTAFVPVRDEMANLPDFLQHHRQLGVRRFVMLDILSTDGTTTYLRAQPDVVLYRTADSWSASASGMRWINALIDRHGAGQWCLLVDADERFIYPGWETMPLERLIGYLDEQGAEGMAAFMLDLHGERLTVIDGRRPTRADCQYYDGDYRWMGYWRAPYRIPYGGFRARFFGYQEMLHKIPLIRQGCALRLNSHEATPLRLADVTGALLHYKVSALLDLAEDSVGSGADQQAAPDRVLEVMRRYARYASRLASIRDCDLLVPGISERLADSHTLADRGLMQMSPEFERWRALHPLVQSHA